MLHFDILLQSTRIQRETMVRSAIERKEEMEAKRERREEGVRQRQDEESLTSVLFMALREQGLSLCPVYWFNADRGWDRGEGGGCWRCVVTDCARWGETMSALILLWHNKTIVGEGRGTVHKALLFCSSEQSHLESDIMRRLYTWGITHSTVGRFYHCATVRETVFSEEEFLKNSQNSL